MGILVGCLLLQFPKLCGFYAFQRQYLDKLKGLGIVQIRKFPAQEIVEEGILGADATSGNTDREAKKEPKKEAKIEAKMEDLMWKFNLLMFAFAIVLGCVFMYLAVAVK